MSGACPADLFYGQLGEAIYDDQSHRWLFTRTPYTTRKFKPLGEPSTVALPSLSNSSSDKIQSAIERNENIKQLTHSFSELVPALSLLAELTKASEIIDQFTTIHDPVRANLLAFGKAEDKILKRKDSKDLPIAAFANGSTGNTLRLVLLRKEQLGWEGDKELGLQRLSFRGAGQGLWSRIAGPILQVCFAETKGKSSPWLAVRYHSATAILHPRLLSNPVQASLAPLSHSQYPPSRIDANHIATLSIQSTGGSPHADVSFNPWDHKQFGIVDDQGHWTLWRLGRDVQHDGLWITKAGLDGHIADGSGEDSESVTKNDDIDGWATILWAGNGDTIVVANRKILCLFHVKNEVKQLISPNLSRSRSTDWILDVRRSPSDDNQIFVTTCTRIFWLHIPSVGDRRSDKDSDLGASVLLSWRHFRHQEDISLRISVLKDEEITMVILYSRLTALSTVFSFQMSIAPPGIPLSVSDPIYLPLRHEGQDRYNPISSGCVSTKKPSVTTLELNIVKYHALDESVLGGLGYQYREGGVKFYQLTILYNDLSLHQCLYASQLTSDVTQLQLPRIRKLADTHKIPKMVKERGFIVPDRPSLEGYQDHILPLVSQEHRKTNAGAETLRSDEDPWTLNFGWLEREISKLSPEPSAAQVLRYKPGTPLDECLELIRSAIIEKVTDNTSGAETLYDALDTNSFVEGVEDVEVASIKLQRFVARISEEGRCNIGENLDNNFQVSKMITPQLLTTLGSQSLSSQDLSLSQIYDSLIKSWIGTLSKAIPRRVRVATEKRLREIATYLCLASFGVILNSKPVENDNEDYSQEPFPVDQQFNLPVRRKRSIPTLPSNTPANPLARSSSPSASKISDDIGTLPPCQSPSHPLAPTLPTPEMTPPLHSRGSISSLGVAPEDAASKRLRVFASLTPQPALPASASDILRHWTEGMNPDDFDWEDIDNTILAEHQGPGDAEAKAKAKSRLGREQRGLRRQRENASGSSSQSAPTRVRESQPSPVPEPQQGSSSVGVGIGGGTMSQISQGSTQGTRDFGGKAARKKKRKEGF